MSERYKIINGDLWDIEKDCVLFCSIKVSSHCKPYINADSVCKFLNLQNDNTNAILENNTKLKNKIDCLQTQLDCTNKNYNELNGRYVLLLKFEKFIKDEKTNLLTQKTNIEWCAYLKQYTTRCCLDCLRCKEYIEFHNSCKHN